MPATDQYALSIMAYELLAGRPPFQGPPMRLMHLHAMTPPPLASTMNPHLSRDMDTVLLHALAKQPEERFASITAFSNAFQQAVQSIQEADVPTRIAAPISASQGDIRAVLAISTMEAQVGTSRTLTLAGGRQVTVPVPAGVQDGQIVRLDGQGEVPPTGGSAGALILSILVKATEDPPALSTASAVAAEATVLTASPETPATGVPTVSDTRQQATVSAAWSEMSVPKSAEVSQTQMAASVSPMPTPSTESAPTTKPSMEQPEEMLPVNQAEQRAGVAPIEQPSQPPATVTVQPPQRGISRRTVVVGLAGLLIIVALMLGIYLYQYFSSSNNSSTPQRTELSYSDFYNQIKAGNIKTATIIGQTGIQGDLCSPVDGNTQYHVVQLPNGDPNLVPTLLKEKPTCASSVTVTTQAYRLGEW